ncbi:MAG: tripartite tricarboxylate transporter substrate-binding protein [Deltaproteobacteria bacterium]
MCARQLKSFSKDYETLKVVLFAFFLLLFSVTPKELPAAPLYEGKVIKMIVGTEPGGYYDVQARLLSKYLPKYIPGKPTIVIENMPGAAGVVASNYIYNSAKPDGLTIGTVLRGLPFAQLLKAEGVKFDLRKFSWIGSVGREATVLAIRTDLPYKTYEDLRKAKDPIYLACSGTTSKDYHFPSLLKEFLGLNIKMVIYSSSTAGVLAIERKEADGRGGSYGTLKGLVERGLLRLLLRGRVAEPGIEDLRIDEDLATDKMGKTLMSLLSAPDQSACRPYIAPPGTPAEVMNTLRDAFDKAVKDPDLQADSKKLMILSVYVTADECLKMLNYIFNQPDDVVREFSKYIKL